MTISTTTSVLMMTSMVTMPPGSASMRVENNRPAPMAASARL